MIRPVFNYWIYFILIYWCNIIFYNLYIKGNISYAASAEPDDMKVLEDDVKYSEVNKINIDSIIEQNSNQSTSEELKHLLL